MNTFKSWYNFQDSSKPLDKKAKVYQKPEIKVSHSNSERTQSERTQADSSFLLPSHKSGKAIDAATLQKFTRGKMPIDARVDLHGMSEAQAYEHFNQFLQASLVKGCRCLLVITGKGRDKQGIARGVLKKRLPEWLQTSSFFPDILHVTPAHIKDGGSGAFYILLRRRKKP